MIVTVVTVERYSEIVSGDFLKKFTPADILNINDYRDLNNNLKDFILNEESKREIILQNIFSIIDNYDIIDHNGNTIAKDINYYDRLHLNIILLFSINNINSNSIDNIISYHWNK